ncbi:phosphatase PAP2 family protein [Flavobacteriaceae bacterium Ap0902]|nr:phosphatase PAP2 family protein [Flavobacteriaceae bacterium Ap0902]
MELNMKRVRYFLLISLAFIFLGLSFCLTNDKIKLHLEINQYHDRFLDIFFKNITAIGDGAFALILLPYLLCYTKSRNYFLSLSTCLVAGVLAQFFKKVIFPDMYSPIKFIPIEDLHLITGVQLHSAQAFSSVHTTSAFAFFILLAFLFARNTVSQIIFGVLVILVGFSRIYLSQHFLADVLFGASLGIISFFISSILINQ